MNYQKIMAWVIISPLALLVIPVYPFFMAFIYLVEGKWVWPWNYFD